MHPIPEKPYLGNVFVRRSAQPLPPEFGAEPALLPNLNKAASRLSERIGVPFAIVAAHCAAAGLGRAF